MEMVLFFVVWTCIVIKTGKCLENVALHKPASMSPYQQPEFVDASKAVDGQSDNTPNARYTVCVHASSGDPKPWVVVDLLKEYHITSTYLINRLDCCANRLHDFIIDVFKTHPVRCPSAQGSVCIKYTGAFGNQGTVNCDTSVLGRFVRIWKPINYDNNDVLNFCEIKVYGEEKALNW